MEKSAMSKYQKYLSTFFLSFYQTARHRNSLAGLSLFLIISITILEHIWKGVASGAELSSHTSSQLLWYITLNNWVLVCLPSVHEKVAKEIQSGHMGYLFPRPVSYLGFTFSKAMGTFASRLLIVGAAGFIYTASKVGLLPLSSLLLSLPFALLAGMVAIIFQMIIGFLALSFRDISPFYWVFEKLCFLLGGILLPLAAYPEWLITLCNLTPFPAILGERSALALSLSLPHIISLIFSYIGWAAVALGALLSLQKKAAYWLHTEGG